MKANWKLVEVNEDYVLIKDMGPWDKHMSITNDVEAVVEAVVKTGYLGNRKLFYIDSDERIDRLLVVDGEFAGFTRECLPPRPPKDYYVDPEMAQPRDDNAFWNAFRKTNPNWRGD